MNITYSKCVSVALYSYIQHVICGLSVSTIFFQHYLINGTIFGKRLLNIKCVFWFSLQSLSETFRILRRIQPDSYCQKYTEEFLPVKYPLFLSNLYGTLTPSREFRKNPQISNFFKMCPVGVNLFNADRKTDRQTALL